MTCIKYILSPLVYLIFILSPLLYLICLLTVGLEDLTLCPTDQHLFRLADLLPVGTFNELVNHLGLSENLREKISEKYPGYDLNVVNFLALYELKKEKYKDLKKISFKDFYEALNEVDYDQHVLCQVGNN
jgi:hypothetical protein